MKTRIYLALFIAVLTLNTRADAPSGLNYQAIARNAAGQPITNQRVGLQFTILQGSSTGTVGYVETDTATTNAFGLFTVVIGNGTATTGTLGAVNWNGPTWLTVGIDVTGGTTYATMGTTQLQYVPYAFSAATSQQWINSGNNMYSSNQGGYIGIGTATPIAPLQINGAYLNTLIAGYRPWLGIKDTTNTHSTLAYDSYMWQAGNLMEIGNHGAHQNGGPITFYTGPNSNYPLYMDTTGYVGIGNTAPTVQLEVSGNVQLDSSATNGGEVNIFLNNSPGSAIGKPQIGATVEYFFLFSGGASYGNGIYINRTNNDVEPDYDNQTTLGQAAYRWSAVYATNGTIQTSDERMKKNISTLDMGLNTVMKLHPVKYEWKNPKQGDGENIGFIAQEVESIVPQAVVHSKPMTDAEIAAAKKVGKTIPEITDPYGMKYSEMIPVLTKAIQDQQAIIEKMQHEIDELKSTK